MPDELDLRERSSGTWWEVDEEFATVPLDAVQQVCLAGLERAGAQPQDAQFVFNSYLDKTLQGDHARGIARIPGLVREALRGDVNLRPSPQILREKGATALVKGARHDLPRLVCKYGMELAVQKARVHGVGWVGAQAPGEVLGAYVKIAVSSGMVGFATTQSYALVAPTGGYQPLLGNGPFAFGIPAGGHDPVILDMSTTHTSASGVFLAARQGQQVPEGMVFDAKGNPTTNAADFPDPDALSRGRQAARGSLVPLGNSPKSYALIFVLGLLTSVLTDSSAPWDVGNKSGPGEGRSGTILAAVDPTAFLASEEVGKRVDGYIDKVKASAKRPGVREILYPGEGSQRLQRERRQAGQIAIPASQYQALAALAKELGLEGAL